MNLDLFHPEIRQIIKLEEKRQEKFWGLYKTRGVYFTCPLCKYHGILNLEEHYQKCPHSFTIWGINDSDHLTIIKFELNIHGKTFRCLLDFNRNKTSINNIDIMNYLLNKDSLQIFNIEIDYILFNLREMNVKLMQETLEMYMLFS